jgi:ABC-type transport system involved in multi-copper enzyme maturation permease subunit
MNPFKTQLQFIKYQFKIIWQINFWLAPLAMALLLLLINYPTNLNTSQRVFTATKLNEQFLPIIGILLFSNLLSQEFEKKTFPLWFVKPSQKTNLLLSRILITTLALGLFFLGAFFFQHQTYVPFSIPTMWFAILVPALFLGIFGCLIGLLFESTAIAIILPLTYWVFEIASAGKITRAFSILSSMNAFSCPTSACIQFQFNPIWFPHKLLLLMLTLALIFLTSIALKNKSRLQIK